MTTSADPARAEGGARSDYAHFLVIPTRWMDNDIYGHVNNVVYYAWFDTVINEYLIEQGGLDIHRGTVVGFAVESQCRYLRPVTFPQRIDAGLRVARIGTSSVVYEIGLFPEGDSQAAARGRFVHLFVDRAGQRPTPIPDPLRAALQRLMPAPAGA
jgi:acyl-CoA thioester hydrolase